MRWESSHPGSTVSSFKNLLTVRIQRGGNPSPFDRNLATLLGGHATELVAQKQFGRMVCFKDGKIGSVLLAEIAGKTKRVSSDNELIKQGERMGISFGI